MDSETSSPHQNPQTDAGESATTQPIGPELRRRLEDVRSRIAAACERSERSPDSVTLVAVTKYAAPEQVRQLISMGVSDFGENYVQQLAQRAGQLSEFHNRLAAAGDPGIAPTIRWHMVGHLQRNKVKQALPHMTMLQTIDSLRLAEELESAAARYWGESAASQGGDRRLPVLLQINCSEEGQKSGVAVGAATHLAEAIDELANLRLMGVMTMAREGADEAEIRSTYGRCREIFEEMANLDIAGADLRHLSMGMSGDYEIAIEEGATIVRVGSAIFGDHAPSDDKEDA